MPGHTQVTPKAQEVIPLATPKAPSLDMRVRNQKLRICVHSTAAHQDLLSSLPAPNTNCYWANSPSLQQPAAFTTTFTKGFQLGVLSGYGEKRSEAHEKKE